MEKCIYDEKNGLSYTLGEDGYYYPDLALPEQYKIGRFGRKHLDYLKKHRKTVYMELLTSGKLNAYLHGIDIQAQEMYERLVMQYAEAQGVTEELKSTDQMSWVSQMNNIKDCVEEFVLKELAYC